MTIKLTLPRLAMKQNKTSMKIMVFVLLVVLAFLPAIRSNAQTVADTAARPRRDTIHTEKAVVVPEKPKPFQPSPKKAGLYSSIVPGMGQLYNREYWKIPVVYVGIGVAGYFLANNLNKYQSYRRAYISRINNPYPTDQYVGRYDDAQLQQLQNDYSKYLDLTVLFSALGYALQVIDAVTSAHLKNFDISRDISLHVRPVVVPGGIGMGLVMNFK
jgi:Family of unknown function (DUF5683)